MAAGVTEVLVPLTVKAAGPPVTVRLVAPVTNQDKVVTWKGVIVAGLAVKAEIVGTAGVGVGVGVAPPPPPPQERARARTAVKTAAMSPFLTPWPRTSLKADRGRRDRRARTLRR